MCNFGIYAQDGSDIHYIDENKIDTTLIGKFIHIDFYKNSFGSNKFQNVKVDTVRINFPKTKLEFIEIRNDDRYNNWFSEQYLETIKTTNDKKIRIEKMKVLKVLDDSINVKLFGHYFYTNGKMEETEFITKSVYFARKDIFQVLVNTKPLIKEGLSIYQVYNNPLMISERKKRDCTYCFKSSENNLHVYPLISEYHIKSYDFENQKIELTKAGKQIIDRLKIPLEGMPVVLTLNGEIIYEFWFWNLRSSFGCDRVYTYPKLDFKLKFGLPENNKFGTDPRFDKRLKKYKKE
jgi:hypothetical protein